MSIDTRTPSTEESNSWAFKIWKTAKAAEDQLRHSFYLELRNVSCDFHEGVLTIRGRVPSYHLKQLAQALLCEIEGVLELNNQLEVVAPGNVRRPTCGPQNICVPPCRRCT